LLDKELVNVEEAQAAAEMKDEGAGDVKPEASDD
jgi:hypothetical protein